MVLDLSFQGGVPTSLFKHSQEFDQGSGKVRIGTATFVVALDGSGDFDSIQEALDSLPSGGGIILIKEGTYSVDSSVVINKDSVTIKGSGHSTIVTASSSVGNLFLIQSNTDYCVIEDIQFDGTNTTAALVGFAGSTTRSRVSGCWFDNWSPQAITFSSAGEGIIIENCTFEVENTATDNLAILINASSFVTIRGNFIRGGTDVFGVQIFQGTSLHILIADNYFVDCFIPVSVIGTSGTTEQVIISNNFMLTSTYAIFFDTAGSSQVIGNQINAAVVGVYEVRTNTDDDITGNLIANCTFGIFITGASSNADILISSNQLDGNSTDIADGGTNTQIGHNIF